MKLVSVLLLSSSLAASAFGVPHTTAATNNKIIKTTAATSPLRKESTTAFTSPLFRDPTITRGGASVPGWEAYNVALDKNPITAKAFTSLVGWALGDLLAQLFISGGPFDWKRFATLSVFGFLYHGPSGHFFYNFLDSKLTGTSAAVVATKVLIDQILWCPIFMTVFFTYLGVVNRDSFSTIQNKIKNDLFTAVQGSWRVWPLVHAINFRFIDTKHRLVFINGVQIAFNMFLSIIGSKK